MTVYSDEIVCSPRAGTLYDVLELILDRGMVIDVFVRVSLVGIEILKVDARIVVASVDTYLRFAEACNRLDLENDTRSKTVPELFGGPVSKAVGKAGAKRAAGSLTDKVRDALTPDDDTEDDVVDDEADARTERARPARKRRSDDDRPRPRRRKAEEE
ncbi:Gas vesicle protein [Streptomyces sp. Ag82_O1-12]|uniref:gas vesicle structural protein GvpA n=1 Tax=unclassified Streptomyces TaxID=2593676 RepID=UPI000BC74881|nr:MULTISPECIES: gas vesicle structural protein GvpA [unclassified Streptomyces]SMQ20911.1 Gas vesicle protein [Streptomyces sp. Ag82_O1-12]SOD49580.1 Gas vesicle protein [Streptomyces sp. Ag82_G6-1]